LEKLLFFLVSKIEVMKGLCVKATVFEQRNDPFLGWLGRNAGCGNKLTPFFLELEGH